jgi:AraC-like DNA-binding protein
MLTLFGKKKITEEKVANILVNSLITTVEESFPEVAAFINQSPEFAESPHIDGNDYGRFLMVVICGNFNTIPEHFQDGHDREIIRLSIDKFAAVFGLSSSEFARKVKDYKEFMCKVNYPSKNNLYAMSKTVFHKYHLNDFQHEHYKSLNHPNPIFMKNLDEVMKNYLRDWKMFTERYKVG